MYAKFSSACVNETKNGLYFPQSLPRPRSHRKDVVLFVLFLIFFIAAFLLADSGFATENFFLFLCTSFCIPPGILVIMSLCARVALFVEEIRHFKSRYEQNWKLLLSNVFYFPRRAIFLFGVVIVLYVFIEGNYQIEPLEALQKFGPKTCILIIISILFLQHFFLLDSGPLFDSLWIERPNGLNYGSGMASSFYHGYLKLILPKTGTVEPDLIELIEDYADKEDVKFGNHKLYILIPHSTFCPTSLKNEFSPSVEECSSLKEKIKTVAGVKDRVYKNPVYRIKDKYGNRTYICAEYATPLKTFNDGMKSSGEYAEFYKKQKNEIVLQFYLTLKKLLEENPDSKHSCELVYYNDKSETGEYYDVGGILLSRLIRSRKIETKKEN